MKNINKYRTPQDKVMAWHKWRVSSDGCKVCANACEKFEDDGNESIAHCHLGMCFNAWLHSTVEDRK